jgi:biotin carboxyl carrier protein
MEHKFVFQGKPHSVKIEEAEDSTIVSVDDKEEIKVEQTTPGANTLSLVVDGKVLTAYAAQYKDKHFVFVNGTQFTFEKPADESHKARDTSVKATGNNVISSMPGSLVKLLVSEGDKVQADQTVAIVEAMKMENELKAPIDGKVKKINFKQGDQVDALTPIVKLEPSD